MRRAIDRRPAIEALEPRVVLSPTIYTVTSIGNNANGSGTSGTLPYVVSQADANASVDGSEIRFDPSVFSTPQTIILAATLVLSETAGPATIDGPGAAAVTVSGGGSVTVFRIERGVTASLSGLTISGGSTIGNGGGLLNDGSVTLAGCSITGNTAFNGGGIDSYGPSTLYGCTIIGNSARYGGALGNVRATATLSDCTISGNSAQEGGGVANYGAGADLSLSDCTIGGDSAAHNGGGLFSSAAASLSLSDCSLSGDSAAHNGGGLVDYGPATLYGCTITGSSAFNGGGLDNYGPTTLSGCTISGNSARYGGGLGNVNALATLSDCTISGNTGSDGGGVANDGARANLYLTGCTIGGNTATGDGGGLFNFYRATLTLSGCTISGGSAAGNGGGLGNYGAANLADCTVSGNTAGEGGGMGNLGLATLAVAACTISANDAQFSGGLYAQGNWVSLTDTIVAGNNDSYGFPDDIFGSATGSYNLIGIGGSGGITGGVDGNIVLTTLDDLDLGPLAPNGGWTETMALLPGSAAIQAGTLAYDSQGIAIRADQRGLYLDTPPDIGAFQLQPAEVYDVTTTADSGAGSLRSAIEAADVGGDGSTILFGIGTGQQTIDLLSALPPISVSMTIDGATQPGDSGAPLIELDGAAAGSDVDGLDIEAEDVTVAGLIIGGFSGEGIVLTGGDDLVEGDDIGTDASGESALGNQDGILIASSDNTIGGTMAGTGNVISGNLLRGIDLEGFSQNTGNWIVGNLIGTDRTGLRALGNSYAGVDVFGSPGNTIGGASAVARNLISGNGVGVLVEPGGINDYSDSGTLIEGNWIGTDITGTAPLGNGVGVEVGGPDTTVGGTTAGAGNLISGNAREGVELPDYRETGDLIAGNLIGTTASGTSALGNGGDGVDVEAAGNTIGGTTARTGDVIAFNGGSGVEVGSSSTDTAIDNAILGDSIFSNVGAGIVVDDVSPRAAPAIGNAFTLGSQTTITGTIAGTANVVYRIEFFANPAGTGQGQTYLGFEDVAATGGGSGSFTFAPASPVTPGLSITATATDPAGNTSEFSAPATVHTSPLTIESIAAVSPDPTNTAIASVEVTFSEPVNPGSFSAAALTLTVAGNPVGVSGVALAPVSGDTYVIDGLTPFTGAQGLYSLTVDASEIRDTYGLAGSGTASTSWLMDDTPPTTAVTLPSTVTSLSFPVTVTATLPTEPPGSPAIGIKQLAVYVSSNGGGWTLWTTLTPAAGSTTATASFTGASDAVYGFYAVATDSVGNTDPYSPTVQASVALPSLNTPVTQVAASSRYDGDGTFTLNLGGTDAGGNGLAYFQAYVAIGAGTPAPIGPVIPAGVASGGTLTATTTYVMPATTYGASSTFRFFSVGIDAAGLREPMHTLADATFSESYSEPAASKLALDSITVEDGAAERSFLRYVTLNFDDATPGVLQAIVDAVDGGSGELTLTQYDLTGKDLVAAVSLSGLLSVVDDAIEIDFGAAGLGGDGGTTSADGYYALTFAPPTGEGKGSTHHFYRLLGDVDGSGAVDQFDLNDIAAARGQSVEQIAAALGQPASGLTALSMDVNGDGTVNNTDLALATKSKGRALAKGLPLG